MAFPIHTRDTAPEGSRPGIEAAQKAFGFVPNVIGALAGAPAAVNGYLAVSEAFGSSSLSPVEQQVVLLTTSVTNECHYCVAAHTAVAGMVGAPEGLATSIRTGEPIAEAKLEALRTFVAAVVTKRGWVDEADIAGFTAAGYGKAQILEVIVGVAQKIISNYTNHIAETPLDEPFKAHAWAPAGATR